MDQRFLFILLLIVIHAACVSTDHKEGTDKKDGEVAESGISKAVVEKWRPPPPNKDDSDWIRLNTGEWLKGDIKVLRLDVFEFDSDKMKYRKFDWKDILEVRSPRFNSILIDEERELTGTLLIRDEAVLVRDEQGKEHRFKRSQLQTIVPGRPEEINYWSGSVGMGLSTRSGNTDQIEYTGKVNLKRRTLGSRFTIDYTGNYGKLEGEQNVNNHRVYTEHDIFITRRFYWIPMSLELYRDAFQNIDHRVTPAAGAGYFIIDKLDHKWDMGGLAGYEYTKYDSVLTDGDDSDSTGAVIGFSDYTVEVTHDVDFIVDYRITATSSHLGESDHRAGIILSVDLMKDMDLDVAFTWDRVGDPQRDSSGDLPEKNDFRLTVGFDWDF